MAYIPVVNTLKSLAVLLLNYHSLKGNTSDAIFAKFKKNATVKHLKYL